MSDIHSDEDLGENISLLEAARYDLLEHLTDLKAFYHDNLQLHIYYDKVAEEVNKANDNEIDLIWRMIYDPEMNKREPQPKPCIICDKELDSVMPDWDDLQPNNGGEVQFHFGYGSSKFDDMESPSYYGVVCDDCAIHLVKKMSKKRGA